MGCVRRREVGAVGEQIEVRGEELVGYVFVELDKQTFEFGDDDARGVVGEAAVTVVVAVVAIPIAVIGFVGSGVAQGEGEQTCG